MLITNKEKIENLFKELKKDFEIFDCRKDKLPFKKYFFPPVQEMFSTNKLGGEIEIKSGTHDKRFVLFGLGLCDLEALTQLDEIMREPNGDDFYFENRKKSIVIGFIKENMDVPSGGDLVLQQIGADEFEVMFGTIKGENLLKHYKDFFDDVPDREREKPQIPTNKSLNIWSQEMKKLLLDAELLSDVVEWSWESKHKVWDELAGKCLGCGVCTYVCPLCYCFSVEDTVGLDDKCSRCRKWDACTLPGFAKIAGGHSFRPTIKERYYNWFYHKFVRAYNEFGKSQCVGCGRCKHACPAGIDIQEILKEILEDYKKTTAYKENYE